MKTLSIVLGVVIIIGAGTLFLIPKSGLVPETASTKTHNNPTLGLSFSYPATYFLEEKNIGTGERSAWTVILTEDTEANRQLRNGTGPAGDGPTAIMIGAFQNNIGNQTAEQWIKNTSNSNFKLSVDGKLSSTTVGGASGLSFTWDGLYRADNVVVSGPVWAFMFTVTYITPDDQIRKDFSKILKTIQFK